MSTTDNKGKEQPKPATIPIPKEVLAEKMAAKEKMVHNQTTVKK